MVTKKIHVWIQKRDYSISHTFLFKQYSVYLDSINLLNIWLHIYFLTEMSVDKIHQSITAKRTSLRKSWKIHFHVQDKNHTSMSLTPLNPPFHDKTEKGLPSDEWHLGHGISGLYFKYSIKRALHWTPRQSTQPIQISKVSVETSTLHQMAAMLLWIMQHSV